jgi:DNA ligase-1
VYHIFDLPKHPGTFEERWGEMQKMQSALSPDIPIKFVKHVRVFDLAKVHQQFEKVLALGYEGLVLKTPEHRYQTRRSYDWLKVKNTREEDLPIVDVFEGTGRLEGSLGGIIVERRNGVRVRVGSGFSDELRTRIWNDPNGYIGKTAEVLYHEETPDGSLRHPRLGKGGIRWDK